MWTKLDDALLDHRKVFAAGDDIGRNGPVIAIGLYTIGLLWTNKHLTDGYLPSSVVKHWQHVDRPLQVAEALIKAGLWERENGGYRIHDFHDHNPTAAEVHEHRERVHDAKVKAGQAGGLKSAEARKHSTKQKGSRHEARR